MNTDTIRRFLTALSSAVKIERGQLYQLVQSAETSYYLRDVQSQHEIGLLLQSFGYPFSQVGKYYESIYLHRTGQHQKAREMLENVVESAPERYRSKALLCLSAVEAHIGRFEESLRLRLQISSSGGGDPLTWIEAQRGIAVLRSLEGDHRAALRELERLMPLAHIIGKHNQPAYLTFLNSYALELSEGNKTTEAEQVAGIIAASPFIGRYPEWQETVLEIGARRKRSSFIAVTSPGQYGHPRIRLVIEFMYANLQRTISLNELAGVANLSASYFSRVFKAQTGFSPVDYLLRLKIERAGELLRDRSLSVKEVMVLVGFNTKSNFSQQFKKHFRLSPIEYRRRKFTRRPSADKSSANCGVKFAPTVRKWSTRYPSSE